MQITAGGRVGDPKANYRWGALVLLKHSFFPYQPLSSLLPHTAGSQDKGRSLFPN